MARHRQYFASNGDFFGDFGDGGRTNVDDKNWRFKTSSDRLPNLDLGRRAAFRLGSLAGGRSAWFRCVHLTRPKSEMTNERPFPHAFMTTCDASDAKCTPL
jgi:hypothetical protein